MWYGTALPIPSNLFGGNLFHIFPELFEKLNIVMKFKEIL
jgi:hypothetical protein